MATSNSRWGVPILTAIAVVTLTLTLGGCLGSTGRSFYTARFQDCKAGPIPARDNFGPGEVPTVVYQNYQGQTVSLKVYNLNSGACVFQKVDYVPREHVSRWLTVPGLSPGGYKAELHVGGTLIQTYTFAVSQ